MNRRLIGLAALVLGLAAQCAGAGAASGDGGPATAIAGRDGVTTPRADVRYVTLSSGRSTVVAAVRRAGGQVVRWRSVRGRFEVPAVTLDGGPGGLSADAATLVLVRQAYTFPQRRTVLALFDTAAMRVRRLVSLRGQFGYDAISPNGGSVYLIQYLSSDQTHYAVRAYDVSTGRLRAKPIVDPHDSGEEMRGYPVSRAYSPDGGWAYTLYDGNGKHPFVHALDTLGGTARCIDMPVLRGKDLFGLSLATGAGGRTLSVVGKHGPLAVVDTRTFRVSQPATRRPATGSGGRGATGPWPLLGFAGLLLAGGALALALRRRRRLAPG